MMKTKTGQTLPRTALRTPLRPKLRPLLLALGVMAASHASALEGRVVATGLAEPVFLTAPRGDARVFVVERRGVIYVVEGNKRSVFLDISSRVDTEGERGLLGLAFDPDYRNNGRFFVNFIDRNTLDTVVVRFNVSAADRNKAAPASASLVIRVPQGTFSNHKAGWIGFRPGAAGRSNLYIATGDGGGSYDPDNNAQNGQTLLGKMLRIDVSGAAGGYTVPADNPFVGSASVLPEIWALGLRNPFRPSFDRATGNFWIADVGQDSREEINFESAAHAGGSNYGWRLREGTRATPIVGGNAPGLTNPVFDYPHTGSASLGNSITGGYVYRGPAIADANGRYIFGDFVSNSVYSIVRQADGSITDLRDDTAALLGGTGLRGIASFGEDGSGRLYAMGINGVVVVMCPDAAVAGEAANGANAPSAANATAAAADACSAPSR